MGIVLGIFAVTLPICIIVFLIITIIRSVKRENIASEDTFENTTRVFYTYMLMIIFLVLIVFSVVSLFNGCLGIILPEATENYYNTAIINRNESLASVTTSMATLCFSIPAFIYFNRLAKKENKNINMNKEEK